MTEQELTDMRSAALRNVDNLQLTGEQWGAFDPTSILKLLDYVQEKRAELIQQTNRAAAAEQQVTALTQRLDMANRLGNDARARLTQLVF